MYSICVMCAAGVGSSVIATTTIRKVVAKMGYTPDEVKVFHTELAECESTSSDLYVTSKSFKKYLTQSAQEHLPIVYVKNIVTSAGMEDAFRPYLEAAIGKREPRV